MSEFFVKVTELSNTFFGRLIFTFALGMCCFSIFRHLHVLILDDVYRLLLRKDFSKMKHFEKAAVKLLVKQISKMDIEDIKTQMRNIYDANGLFVNDDEIDYVSKKIKESPNLLSESLQEIILKGGQIYG